MSSAIRVLHVEDDPDFAALVAEFLEREDDRLDVVTVHDPAAAVDRLADERVDCVVSDYDLPGRDGVELLESIRADHPNLPFVLFTGRGSEDIASEAIDAGVTNYLQKGKHEQYYRLANCVDVAIDQYQTERALEKRRRQFETVFEASFDGIFILDMDDAVIRDANERACELLEYPYEELVGTDIADVHPEDHEEYVELGRRLIETDDRRRVESVCYTRNGTVIPSDITAAPMEYDDHTYLLTIMRPQRTGG
jgi:PAS domain S-box-containing protein